MPPSTTSPKRPAANPPKKPPPTSNPSAPPNATNAMRINPQYLGPTPRFFCHRAEPELRHREHRVRTPNLQSRISHKKHIIRIKMKPLTLALSVPLVAIPPPSFPKLAFPL